MRRARASWRRAARPARARARRDGSRAREVVPQGRVRAERGFGERGGVRCAVMVAARGGSYAAELTRRRRGAVVLVVRVARIVGVAIPAEHDVAPVLDLLG